MTDQSHAERFIEAMAQAPWIDSVPQAVDLSSSIPMNPPEWLQQQIVGKSFRAAYEEAASFVAVSDQSRVECGGASLAESGLVLDFGCGWGRISRVLLTRVPRDRLYSVDVDPGMIAIVNATLPGLNAMTVPSLPPTIVADSAFDSVFGFSVFSHLSEEAHRQWAVEFGRVVRPNGFVFVTVLDSIFFDTVRGAQAAIASGASDGFSRSFANLVDDVGRARREYMGGGFVYAATGGGGVLSDDYFGWAAAPPEFIARTWSAAGFNLVRWVPSRVHFDQALVVLQRRVPGEAPRHVSLPRQRPFIKRVLGRLSPPPY